MMKRILFIGHDGSRTGAPIVLLHLLNWLKKNTDISISLLLLWGGDMEPQYQEAAPTMLWHLPQPQSIWAGRIRHWTRQQRRHEDKILKKIQDFQPDIIYSNTVISAEMGVRLKRMLNVPLVCHVHELQGIIDAYIGRDKFIKISKSVDLFFAASQAVGENLVQQNEIHKDDTVVVYEFIDTSINSLSNIQLESIRKELGIPNSALIIGGSGAIQWRKGSDLFIQLSAFMKELRAELPYFVWLGSNTSFPLFAQQLLDDVQILGLTEHVKFIGARPNAIDYMQIFDVFTLCSREDPYPLVCLEAAAIGKPVLCFADSGGMPEFVAEDAGFVVPYLRADIMAQRINLLLNNSEARQQLGTNAQNKVRQQHDVNIASVQIVSILEELFNKQKSVVG
jgi:glycosyltransferase involved in cell wall biosynthesis